MKGRRVVAALSLALLLVPRLVQACPMCASQQPGGVARIIALGAMILLPFAISFVVFRSLRRSSAVSPAGSADGAVGSAGGAVANTRRERAAPLEELRP